MCYEVQNKAKKVYSNDVCRLYNVITTKLENMNMHMYLGKLDCLVNDYNNLMPSPHDVETFHWQHNQYFMVLALAGLPLELDSVRNQILLAPIVPTYDMFSEQLLHLSTLHILPFLCLYY